MNQNTLTKAPITPKEVRRKYSKGLCLETVFKNGYKYNGIWAKSKKRKRHKYSKSWKPKNRWTHFSQAWIWSRHVKQHTATRLKHCKLGYLLD